MPLYIFVLIPVIVGIITEILPLKRLVSTLVLISQLFLMCLCLWLIYIIQSQGVQTTVIGDYSAYLGIVYEATTFTAVLMTGTVLIFTLGIIYNLHKHYMDKQYVFLFSALEGMILGIFLSVDLFNIFVLMEASTIIVSILIMYKKDSRSVYDGMIYLLVNIVAMTFFLFGIGIVYQSTGQLNIYYIQEILNTQPPLILGYTFMMTGVCLKAAVMPLFSWLPKAHGTPGAPTAVSSILSAVYVKMGLYLFIKVQFMFSGNIEHSNEFFLFAGIITAIVGALFALTQTDIKLLLAYSTVSQLGIIITAMNIGSDYAYYGAFYYVISHLIFKALLFFVAGIIVDAYHSKNLYKITGVSKTLPYITFAALLGIFGITGAPLLNGSIAKYLISHGTGNPLLSILLIVINFGTILYYIKFFQIFIPKKNIGYIQQSVKANRTFVVFILGLLCIVSGIFAIPFINSMFETAFEIDTFEYFIKTLQYIAMVIIGFFLYRYIKDFPIMKKGGKFDLGFNQIIMTIIGFFLVLTGYIYITNIII
jgi:multicomponent Na+:H+ antiporter subunit D